MQIADRKNTYFRHAGDNKPSIFVNTGEIFAVDTELNTGTWLQKVTDIWSEKKAKGTNPTVCIGINGAVPGNILAVDILGIVPEKLGYTCIMDKQLNMAIVKREMEPCPRTVTINNGYVEWSDKLKIPVKPMVGTMGTSSQEGKLNSYGGYYGGNMDVSEITTGTTVYLPVNYPDALLNIGDVHAVQGDGEICKAGGIECRARVTLRVGIKQAIRDQLCVRAENDRYLMAIACLESTDESFYLSCSELIRFVCSRYAISVEECFNLASQVMEARCTQFVNPTRSYICKIPKIILDQGFDLLTLE